MSGQRHSIECHWEWNRTVRLKMHVNVVRPGKQRDDVLCLEQRVCEKRLGPCTPVAVL